MRRTRQSNVANLLEAQWVRGKAFPRGNQRTPWKKAPNDCDHPPSAIQKGGNAVDVLRTMRDLAGIGGSALPLAMAARDSKTTLSNRTVRSRQQGSDRSRSNALFCPHGHGSMMMQATPQQESLLGMLDVHYNIGTQPGRVRRSLGPGGASRVSTRSWFPLGRTRPRSFESAGTAEISWTKRHASSWSITLYGTP